MSKEDNDDSLFAALYGQMPCDGCVHREMCAAEKMACIDFHFWVNTGKVRNKNRHPVKLDAAIKENM